MSSLPPDYDHDPDRWRSWRCARDIHHLVAPRLRGPVLDVGCGDSHLAALLGAAVSWTGVDSSSTALAGNPFQPLVRVDMRTLPFSDDRFAEVVHLWCLYHLADPVPAIREAARVLRPGGWYFACTGARDNDPELVAGGYPPTSFDAEEAAAIVASVFREVSVHRWDRAFFPLGTREQVRAYCRHHYVAPARAEQVELPLWLTKRGVLVTARKVPGLATARVPHPLNRPYPGPAPRSQRPG